MTVYNALCMFFLSARFSVVPSGLKISPNYSMGYTRVSPIAQFCRPFRT